ncbi:MAG TPA: DUF2149 domain-containing protein [Thiopseudomonas sp.]|nr:DUF2149 domain-containing protein [Thiopseudomonas sp.]
MSRLKLNILEEEDDDPIAGAVNIIDVFLVIIAVLLVILMSNPLNPFATEEEIIVIKNPGKPNMEMLIKDGTELKHYQSSGEVGEGKGSKAGITYKMDDGSMIYVPE